MNKIKCFSVLFFLVLAICLKAQMPVAKYHSVGKTKLCYYEQGKGETIILLHGWPQTSYAWRKVIPELSKNNRVIAVDLPGLGNSGAPDKYDTQSIADILASFIDDMGIEKVHLVGHDVGSWVAVSFALKYENKLKSLTILDAAIPGLSDDNVFKPQNADKVWQFYFHAIAGIPEILVAGREKEYINWYFSNKSFIKTAINKKDLNHYYKAYKGRGKMANGFNYYRAFPESARQNKKNLHQLKIPIYAIGGEYALGANVDKAFKNISNPVIEVIKNSGHYIPEEQPQELIRLLKKIISIQ
ncbi:alpha/beta hydrolase [uncultured Bacteroides sp.]|uniref:alpha/beta fold hydrolase n=1 Tax=uncultured Bacteroides sp. TaxID=162156 RepID=UPI002AA68E7D|nr:alpha/beta hydrolase [uncultured Bacteroides sp.]